MMRFFQPIWLLPVALVLAGALLASWFPPRSDDRIERLLSSRAAPFVVGLVSLLAYWWIQGSLNPVAVIHDEAAYLLQAQLFASGHWTAPSPPLPEFFEQFHVFVVPRLAPKYPPGQGLALTPGVLLGAPGLMPLIFTGLTAGLFFALARRFTNGWVALLAWAIWLVAPADIRFRGTYFSETTTSFLWLAAWWALLAWRERRGRAWLVALACAVAFGIITRPQTMLIFAIPVAGVVLYDVIRERRWAELTMAAAAGGCILALLPIQNYEVFGDWRVSPMVQYSETYFPFDVPGFGINMSPAKRELPPDMKQFTEAFRPGHADYTPARLPHALYYRGLGLAFDTWGIARTLAGVAFGMIGLLVAPAPVLFAALTSALLMIGYLVYYHSPIWTVYYLEIQPVLTLLTAMGIWQLTRLVAWYGRPRMRERWRDIRAPAGIVAVFVLVAPLVVWNLRDGALHLRQIREYHAYFRGLENRIPGPAIVFVRYQLHHTFNFSLITNPPSYDKAKVWLVYDRGADDARLLRLAPGRTPYLLDEATARIYPMTSAVAAAPAPEPPRP
ncbi:MAG TPA: glycosyltransferase family 39 protein [Gemmatimonadales bacterium]|nr:glycosyltransferase family 39 protein [Gemmatimonadales bacterium]